MLTERANYNIFNARHTASSSAENLGLEKWHFVKDISSSIDIPSQPRRYESTTRRLYCETCILNWRLRPMAINMWSTDSMGLQGHAKGSKITAVLSYAQRKNTAVNIFTVTKCVYEEITLHNANSAQQNTKFCQWGFHNLCFFCQWGFHNLCFYHYCWENQFL